MKESEKRVEGIKYIYIYIYIYITGSGLGGLMLMSDWLAGG